MTALLALVGPSVPRDDEAVRALLERGREGEAWTFAIARLAPDVVLGVASPAWDEPAATSIATDGRYTVIAHAAVFYRDTLSRALVGAGEPPIAEGTTSAQAILAAVRAWRWRSVEHIEGEFAFIVWDAKERTLYAARDHAGARTLFYSPIGDGLAVASALRLLRSVPGCQGSWNLMALAEDAADIDLAHAAETAFTAIARLPGGHQLLWSPGRSPTASRWWEIPIFEQDSGLPFEEAAEELRRLIADAVQERADLSRGSVVMLSGGYDSTAIFAAGSWRLRSERSPVPLGSVSFSHPTGDPGREDELIEAVTARWGTSPHFIDNDSVPAIEPSLARARARDEPFYHTYELWNRALARGCRTQGAHVALNGNGGDPWFSTSPVFLADLFRQGRLLEFRREWKLLIGGMTWYRLFKQAIQPNLSPGVLALIARMRQGRPLRDQHDRPIPSWFAEDFRRSPELQARRAIRYRRRPGEGLSAAERTWFLHSAFSERVAALVFSICQRERIELRTPLLDNRIVQFAASRPRWESNSGRQNKHLLRRSMEGLLPPEVIAPRTGRTGLPVTYFDRTLRAHLVEARDSMENGMLLAKLGIGDHTRLLDEIDSFLTGRWEDRERAASLVAAVQAEWWLRSFE